MVKLGFLAFPLAVQPGFRIGGGIVGIVAAPLVVEVLTRVVVTTTVRFAPPTRGLFVLIICVWISEHHSGLPDPGAL